jgi:hypothetical protein
MMEKRNRFYLILLKDDPFLYCLLDRPNFGSFTIVAIIFVVASENNGSGVAPMKKVGSRPGD